MSAAASAVTNTANQYSADGARLAVLDAIQSLGRPFSVGDIVAQTGLPPYLAEQTLSGVVREYECDLDVDDVGNLTYRFPNGLKAREDIVKADAARRRKEKFRQTLIAFFKAWTVAMVIIYFVIYVVMIIAFFVAMSKASENSSSRRRSTTIFTWGWGSPFGYGGYGSWSSRRAQRRYSSEVERRIGSGEDPYGFERKSELKKPSLSERTWFHLFGTAGIKRNPLEKEKELLTYIRAKRGFVSNADIVALLGVTYDEADSIGTRLVATYDGELDLTDDGVAIYRFPNLQLAGAPEVQEQVAQLGYLWQVREKEHLLRSHPSRVVPVLNVVNLILAGFVGFVVMPSFGMTGAGAIFGLIALPVVFSLTFLFLGVRRALRDAAQREQYERDSKRIAIFKLLFARRAPVRLPGHERDIAAVGFGSWSTDELLKDAQAIANDVRGEVRETGRGVEIHAQRIWDELTLVDRLRTSAVSLQKVGRTVFSTRIIAGASPIGDVPAAGAASNDALASEIAALEKELSN
jgi:uncharacterized membrane protein